jgi:hypothetical protein
MAPPLVRVFGTLVSDATADSSRAPDEQESGVLVRWPTHESHRADLQNDKASPERNETTGSSRLARLQQPRSPKYERTSRVP